MNYIIVTNKMNKQGKTKIYVGFLILCILSASIYILLPNNVRIDVGKTSTTFKVWENESWVLAGTERTILMDSSAIMRAKSRDVEYSIENNITKIIRTATFKNNITVIDTYIFDGSTKEVKLFPISHTIKILNAKNAQTELNKNTEFILVYEVKDLLYNGETISGISSPQEFGHKMKVEWEDENYYSKIYKYSGKDEGKLTVKYRIDSNDFEKDVRLFDPPIEGNNLIIANGQTVTLGGNNDTYDTVWVQTGGTLQIDNTYGYLNLIANNIIIDGVIDGFTKSNYSGGARGSSGGSSCANGGSGSNGEGFNGGVGGHGASNSDCCSSCDGSSGSGGAGATQVGTETGRNDLSIGFGAGGGGASNDECSYYGGNSYYYSGTAGAAGGASVRLYAKDLTIDGTITSAGGNGGVGGTHSSTTYQNDYLYGGGGGGGASGGTIIIDGENVDISSSTLNVAGGNGGSGGLGHFCSGGSSGGTGAGGRIKIFFASSLENADTTIITGTGSYFEANAPLSISNLISDDSNFTTEDIKGYCNGTVESGKDMTYYWKLYDNDVLNESGNTGIVTKQVNVVNISSDWLVHNDTWKLECIVGDGTYNTTDSYELQVHQPIWINITNPEEGIISEDSYHTITQDFENYTKVDSCWYTNDSGVTNQSITCGADISANWLDGLNKVTIYSKVIPIFNIYDDFLDNIINNNLWNIHFVKTGAGGTNYSGENNGVLYTSIKNAAVGDPASVTSNMTAINIKNINILHELNMNISLYAQNPDGDMLGTSSKIFVFGNEIKEIHAPEISGPTSSSDNSIWKIIENNSGYNLFDVYDDNVYQETITANNNLVSLYGYVSGPWNGKNVTNKIYSINESYNYETSDTISFITVIGPADIEYIAPTPDNDIWLSQDYLNIATYISNCESFKNATYHLRSIIIDTIGVLI